MLAEGEQVIYKARVSKIAYIFAFTLLLVFAAVGRMSGLLATGLVLTNRRVIGSIGLLRKRRLSFPLAEIALVKARQGLFGKIFDYGSLTLLTHEGRKYTFSSLAEPAYVRLQIEEAVEVAVLGHRLSDYTAEKF